MNDQPCKDQLDSKCFNDTILVLRSKLTTDQATLMTSIRINVWNTVFDRTDGIASSRKLSSIARAPLQYPLWLWYSNLGGSGHHEVNHVQSR